MMAPFLKLPIRHRRRPEDLPGVSGAARLDRTHQEPHQAAAARRDRDHRPRSTSTGSAPRRCCGQQVAAVVNAAPSISGRYPNLGPQILVEAGIPLIDDVGPDVFTKVSEGDLVRLDGETLYVGDEVVAKGTAADRRDGRRRDGRGQGRPRRAARGVRGQHDGVPEARARAAARRRRRARDPDQDRRPARAGRGPRLPLPRGPGDAAALHPGVPAGPDRRGRRRRRAAGGRLPAGHDRRRHGLGLRQGAALRRRDRRARLPGRPGARPGAGRAARASRRCSSRPPAPARTSRCCWPTTRAPA